MALKWLRDNLRHLKFILWGVVAVFVLLVFVDWGSGRAGGGSTAAAVKVGRTEVSERDFVDQVRRLQELYQRQLGDNWEQFKDQVDLGQQAVQQIVERQILLKEADRVGLVVSAAELQDEILSLPVFSNERGEFVGQEQYRRILRTNRTSPQEFEAQLRDDLLLSKLRTMMQDGIWVSETEVDETIRRDREEASISAVQLRYERLLADVSIDEAAAQEYFAAHQDDFFRSEERVIRYLVVETNKLRRLLEVEQTELEVYYNERLDDFREGEQVHARHILFRVDPGASEVEGAEAELRANRVAGLARGEADFAQLAEQHSDDPGSKANGGDLGWFGRGRMVAEFEEAVFGAKPGDIVGPVKSQFGFHVIKVEGYRPDRIRPFEEVREDVQFQYLESQAAAEAESVASRLAQRLTAEQLTDDAAWQAVADEDESVVLNESPPFTAEGPIPGAGSDPGLATQAFEASQGAVGGPHPVPRGWIVWQLKEIRPEGVPPFEDVQAEVEQLLRREGAMELAHENALGVAESLRAGADLDLLATENDTTVVEVQNHKRGAAFASLGMLPGLDTAVFDAQVGEVVGPVTIPDRGAVIARVNNLRLVGTEELEDERNPTRQRLMTEKADLLLASIINDRRRDTPITVNNELLARFSPQQR